MDGSAFAKAEFLPRSLKCESIYRKILIYLLSLGVRRKPAMKLSGDKTLRVNRKFSNFLQT